MPREGWGCWPRAYTDGCHSLWAGRCWCFPRTTCLTATLPSGEGPVTGPHFTDEKLTADWCGDSPTAPQGWARFGTHVY